MVCFLTGHSVDTLVLNLVGQTENRLRLRQNLFLIDLNSEKDLKNFRSYMCLLLSWKQKECLCTDGPSASGRSSQLAFTGATDAVFDSVRRKRFVILQNFPVILNNVVQNQEKSITVNKHELQKRHNFTHM